MSGRSFKSVAWVATIGAAAVTCYMFSSRVAAERTSLAELNAEIVRTEAAIKTLRTELGTRGRVQQLEHWASNEFGYAAPRPGQVVDGEVRLATLEMAPEQVGPAAAPVRMASAEVTRPANPNVVLASAPAPAPRAAAPRPAARPEIAPAPADNALLHRAALVHPVAHPAPAPAKAEPAPRRVLLDPRTVRDLGERARSETARPARAR